MRSNAVLHGKNENCRRTNRMLAAAAAMSGAIDIRGARVGIIVSGGNVDAESYADFLKRGKNIL